MGGYGEQSVEVLTLGADTAQSQWRTGPTLPSRFSYGQSVVFQDTLYLVRWDGYVVKMVGDKWVDVARIGRIGSRPVYPAPLVTADMLGC